MSIASFIFFMMWKRSRMWTAPKDLGNFLPGQPFRPARQEPAKARRLRTLSLGPRHLLDGHAALPAVHSPHRIREEHGDPPQRYEIEPPRGQAVVARPGVPAAIRSGATCLTTGEMACRCQARPVNGREWMLSGTKCLTYETGGAAPVSPGGRAGCAAPRMVRPCWIPSPRPSPGGRGGLARRPGRAERVGELVHGGRVEVLLEQFLGLGEQRVDLLLNGRVR